MTVGYIKPEDFREIQQYHDRLVKRWRQRGVTHRRPMFGDWVVIRWNIFQSGGIIIALNVPRTPKENLLVQVGVEMAAQDMLNLDVNVDASLRW